MTKKVNKFYNDRITQPVSNHVLLQNALQQTLLPPPHITSQNSPCPYSSPQNQLLLCANFFKSVAWGCFTLEMTDDFLKSQLHWGITANGAASLRTLQLPHACFGESHLFSSLFVVKINDIIDGGIKAPQQPTQARQSERMYPRPCCTNQPRLQFTTYRPSKERESVHQSVPTARR